MSDIDILVRAREALDGITPGEWRNVSTEADAVKLVSSEHGPVAEVAPRILGDFLAVTDARFIAAAPQLVAELADEVKRLRAESGDLRVALEEILHVQHGEANEWETVEALLDGTLSRQDLIKRLWDDENNAIAERDRLRATIARVGELAERWDTEPCICGYRIPNGNDDDSQCLHCAADIILCALDGEAQG